MESDNKSKSKLFQDFTNTPKPAENIESNNEEEIQQPTEVESLCVNCGENGITTLLLAKIPHYREIILSSFICESCGYRNNDIQGGGAIQLTGVVFKVSVCTFRINQKSSILCKVSTTDFQFCYVYFYLRFSWRKHHKSYIQK